MKNILFSAFFFLTSIFHGIAQEQLIVRTVLNTSEGKALDGITVTINGTGNKVTKGAGFATFPDLKKSHAKTSGDAINLYLENTNLYALVNHYALRNYTLPKDRSMPVEMILAKNEEKDKYIKQHLAYIGKISLEKDFDKKEDELRKQIDKHRNAFEKLALDSQKERGGLMNKIDSLYKQLDFIQKQRVEKTNISEQIAGILAQSSQPDTSLLNAYAHFSKGNFELAQKALNPNQIDQERLDYENHEKLALAYATLAKEMKKNYIPKCLLKAKLYGLVPKIDSSEIWFEKAYQADTNNANTLFEYAYFLAQQNRPKRPAELYERALIIYESLAKDNPQQYLPDVASTLNNLGIFYQVNNLKEKAQEALERALMIYESLLKDNSQQYLPSLANTLYNLGIFYKDNNLKEQAQNAYERALMIFIKVNPKDYLPEVAMTLNNLGILYQDNNLKEKAQNAYEKALMLYEAFAKVNQKQYLPYLAQIQINYAVFWADENEINKTEELTIKGLKSYQTIAILLNDERFWQKAKPVKDILLDLVKNDSIYQHKLNLEQAIIDFNSQYPLATNEEKASALGNGAWYALFCKEYQLSEDYARKGLAIAPEQHWLYTNLALALLLQNRWDEAKPIYQEKQNLIGNNKKPLKESFLNDLIDLEKAGIKHPDFEKVRALLK